MRLTKHALQKNSSPARLRGYALTRMAESVGRTRLAAIQASRATVSLTQSYRYFSEDRRAAMYSASPLSSAHITSGTPVAN